MFLPNRVEWDRTFCDFWKWALSCRSGIFLWVQFQKYQRIWPRAAMFSLWKNQRDLKNEYFFGWKFAETFLIYNIREQSTKIKFEIKICLIFFSFFQKWATLYLICTREKYFFTKQAKEKFYFQVQPLKC